MYFLRIMNNRLCRGLVIFGLCAVLLLHGCGKVNEAVQIPRDHSSLQFIVMGDWGMQGAPAQMLVAKQMDILAATTKIDFIVTTGDNFYPFGVKTVDDPLWGKNFEAVYSLPHIKDIPWYVTLGNHDYFGDYHAQIEYGKTHPNWILPAEYYAKDFKLGNKLLARFIFADSNPYLHEYQKQPGQYHGIDREDPPIQTKWLEKQLRDKAPTWKIVIAHHPLYTSGAHGNINELIQAWSGLFEQYGVNAYFAGHDHHLEHLRPAGVTNYFISGGGGARIRRVLQIPDSLFVQSSHGFAHVILDQSCMQVRFINAVGDELYRTAFPVRSELSCKSDKNLIK